MKIAQVTNFYRSGFGGEVTVFNFLVDVLRKRGSEVVTYTRDSSEINSVSQKALAFMSGLYSLKERASMLKFLSVERPDVVHVHNLYPLLSPSILVACREQGVPVVMHLHNYGLTCPIGLHFVHGRHCVKCLGGREYWGTLQNCGGKFVKSSNYSARMAIARSFGLLKNNVDVFIAVSEFAMAWNLRANVVAEGQIRILHNAVSTLPKTFEASPRVVIGFAGRLEAIKGVSDFIEIARKFPDEQFEIVGDGPLLESSKAAASRNVKFLGRLEQSQMAAFYARCRAVLFPTRVFEGLPLVVLEAMSHGVPVVASRIGGIPEVIEDGLNGLLCDIGDFEKWVQSVSNVLTNPELMAAISVKARQTIEQRFSEDKYYDQLMAIYRLAIERRQGRQKILQ